LAQLLFLHLLIDELKQGYVFVTTKRAAFIMDV